MNGRYDTVQDGQLPYSAHSGEVYSLRIGRSPTLSHKDRLLVNFVLYNIHKTFIH